ncbi:argininosuccinate lyase-like [Clavelina lepadiformis]|uniref:Argininosuccinate lyase n=1 Tax=Clavelina lepadiformis TaxID=159417 RepID=A0ABP0GSX8_CLALP
MTEMKEETKLWGGRFDAKIDVLMEKFNSSISFDQQMWQADIQGSKAYAKALHKAKLITEAELEAMLLGLDNLEKEWSSEKFEIKPSDEDIHTANERRLSEIIGADIAGKLHTGRSRNDQVVTDTRLWLRSQLNIIKKHLCTLILAITSRAEEDINVLMPGYTHLQRAQPIRWSHWLMSYGVCLLRDMDKVVQIQHRVSTLPLGCGALAGNPFAIDRQFLADELKFQSVSLNSMDTIGNRDFIAEVLFWATQVCNHLSRLAEDLIIFASNEFSFVKLSDAFSTGSSLMPQKKNPDSLELIRGKAGTVLGRMTGFMATTKGLPSTYNKDLQEDKVALFEVCDTTAAMIQIAAGVISTLEVNQPAMKSALSYDMLATDVAYYLVRKGVPFREAHALSGQVVKKSEKLKCKLNEVPFSEMLQISDKFAKDIEEVWDFESSVEQYTSAGGTSKSCVLEQIKLVRIKLNEC